MHTHVNAYIQHDIFSNKFYHQHNESTICDSVSSNESTKTANISKITRRRMCIGWQNYLILLKMFNL